MLEILAHRGWWKRRDEQNEIVAFERAFEAGYGVETDVRDLNGVLVISHDMAQEGGLTLDQMLDIRRAFGRPGVLALNVKCDGLCAPLVEAISRSKVERYFVFDMSVPDTLPYLRAGAEFYTRRSEYEAGSPLDDKASGIWWDCFSGEGEESLVSSALIERRPSAFVSPELHRRSHAEVWQAWKRALVAGDGAFPVQLCTDFPDVADVYFNAKTQVAAAI